MSLLAYDAVLTQPLGGHHGIPAFPAGSWAFASFTDNPREQWGAAKLIYVEADGSESIWYFKVMRHQVRRIDDETVKAMQASTQPYCGNVGGI